MTHQVWLRAGLAAVLVSASLTIMSPSGALAAPAAPGQRYEAPKAPASRLARTDESLLGRQDSAMVSVVVKLDYDPVATYDGGVRGYAATNPALTGRQLGRSTPAEKSCESYLAGKENAFVGAVQGNVPTARVGSRLRTVYGGVALQVPANRVSDLLGIDGVVAVQKDEPRRPQTDASTELPVTRR
jgi:hypothetical protein